MVSGPHEGGPFLQSNSIFCSFVTVVTVFTGAVTVCTAGAAVLRAGVLFRGAAYRNIKKRWLSQKYGFHPFKQEQYLNRALLLLFVGADLCNWWLIFSFDFHQ
jgi:hypothetical protein